jgi:hypothetical protein
MFARSRSSFGNSSGFRCAYRWVTSAVEWPRMCSSGDKPNYEAHRRRRELPDILFRGRVRVRELVVDQVLQHPDSDVVRPAVPYRCLDRNPGQYRVTPLTLDPKRYCPRPPSPVNRARSLRPLPLSLRPALRGLRELRCRDRINANGFACSKVTHFPDRRFPERRRRTGFHTLGALGERTKGRRGP